MNLIRLNAYLSCFRPPCEHCTRFCGY